MRQRIQLREHRRQILLGEAQRPTRTQLAPEREARASVEARELAVRDEQPARVQIHRFVEPHARVIALELSVELERISGAGETKRQYPWRSTVPAEGDRSRIVRRESKAEAAGLAHQPQRRVERVGSD